MKKARQACPDGLFGGFVFWVFLNLILYRNNYGIEKPLKAYSHKGLNVF